MLQVLKAKTKIDHDLGQVTRIGADGSEAVYRLADLPTKSIHRLALVALQVRLAGKYSDKYFSNLQVGIVRQPRRLSFWQKAYAAVYAEQGKGTVEYGMAAYRSLSQRDKLALRSHPVVAAKFYELSGKSTDL